MALEVIQLADETAGSRARILPGFGFNCFSFEAQCGGPHEVLWSEVGFESGEKRPSGSGIPLLFPFPGRLAGTTLTWGGKIFELEAGDGRGNAIHGFVLCRPWRVIEQTLGSVTGQFQASVDDPDLLKLWPADFCITATYRLAGNKLESEFLIENPDEVSLPCGFGIHPYFRLPVERRKATETIVELPVTKHWELVDMLPTGRSDALADAERFQRGIPFGEMQLDDVFADLAFESGECQCAIREPDGCRMLLRFNDEFRECVVYTPPHREAVCIEPYTCVPGILGSNHRPQDYGIRELPPGQSYRALVGILVT